MEVVTYCFKTIFNGLAMQELAFGPIRGVYWPQQQQHDKGKLDRWIGAEMMREEPLMTLT